VIKEQHHNLRDRNIQTQLYRKAKKKKRTQYKTKEQMNFNSLCGAEEKEKPKSTKKTKRKSLGSRRTFSFSLSSIKPSLLLSLSSSLQSELFVFCCFLDASLGVCLAT
jgi:hypothetical protein